MSDVANSYFRGITHGIMQLFINLLLERLHLTQGIELSEYSISKKLQPSAKFRTAFFGQFRTSLRIERRQLCINLNAVFICYGTRCTL